MAQRIEYNIGDKIGNLIYKGNRQYMNKFHHADFQCVCGKIFFTTITSVKRLHTKSCGCIQKDIQRKRLTKHGKINVSGYSSWKGMIDRCHNPDSKDFKNYGGRGIMVCYEWRNSCETFLNDMGERPSPNHSVERENVNGNYEKSNCRWATPKEQSSNRRNTIFMAYQNEVKAVSKWAYEFGIKNSKLYDKLRRGHFEFRDNTYFLNKKIESLCLLP